MNNAFRPKFIEYTGFAEDQTYGCGDCPQGSSSKCEECDGNEDTACNTIKQPIGRDFKCANYEYKDDVPIKKDEPVTCKRLEATAMICKMFVTLNLFFIYLVLLNIRYIIYLKIFGTK